ncbi:Bacterial transcription activator, effector binding domain [Corynebacterium occultum]|uniref:Bacterial transcription activator, effector binding domain n=1 Tax=Corynebacterium occultum TaxID=2675219 RepID=A0A6B8VSK6_9CORY|nr:GyrI-like domain-containing protein [Corynebacterium occultum]QGU06049.1 Bacterial transcription activator, effector binding domain [Corynebacterium occultum]
MVQSTQSPGSNYLNAEAANEIEFFKTEEIPTVVQKFEHYPMSEMRTAFDSTFSSMKSLLEPHDIHPTGPAFALHHSMPGKTATFEIGIPVNRALKKPVHSGTGVTLENSSLPAKKVARLSVFGSYAGLGGAWQNFMNSVFRAGKKADLPFWEVYVSEPTPDTDPETLRTDLYTATSHTH